MQEWQEQIEERLKKVEQQQTEPIQVTIERRYPDRELLQDISRKQDEHAKALISHSRSISTLQTDITAIKTEIQEMRADILAIKESQADFRDILKKTATKDDVKNMSTKEDITAMETHLIETVKQLLQKGDNNEESH